jgi:hypothetical protein
MRGIARVRSRSLTQIASLPFCSPAGAPFSYTGPSARRYCEAAVYRKIADRTRAHGCLSHENDPAGRQRQSGQLGASARPLSKVWRRSASNSTPTARSRRQHFSRGLAIPQHQRRVRVAWNRAHETDYVQKLLGTNVALTIATRASQPVHGLRSHSAGELPRPRST